ncbi:hybrid sensor histidine kinase/response regulator [Nostoc sp. 'Peltigera membranacea cyanobiont' 210A]|uniref:hybrid sensor histidine kinase/response regulator n=1 Tax=Nostoc sp. 'Peltigera membranacea cyanobiont' 210A TaxID=2014529 RepID=UPI000B95BE24|nr:ATP-binding protein [Nostoc sp. 'Peltigera membranacea cyanobiont' 210A]OYD97839.1 hybrid sensor histidine kinase/response regulator [Nostoc sp. 'Peltigera membranacea cyanobiont' 210A]
MPDFLSNFLSTSFIPHGHCYLWKPGLVWLHLTSDALTAIAYYSVAIAIVYFTNQRKDLPANTVTLLTGYFFVFALCGTTHLMGVVTLWYPIYWFTGLLKAFNAIWSSYAFTFLLIPLIPIALDAPSPAQLAITNQELLDSRSRIQSINVELEQRVQERTAELEASNRAKDELLIREQVIRAEAEAANRAKDEFLSVLSHELRTPLNAILGWSQMLRKQHLSQDRIMRALETIERNARSQTKIVEDILDISGMITGKLRLQVRPVNLVQVIEAAIESVRLAAEAKSIRIQSVLDGSKNPISGDADRLQQVVWNLLSNAIKFTPKGGKLQIRLERINSHVEITVSDTGVGISPDFLPYVFDRFRQHDSTTTRSYGGLGLGLAIARQLIELHGGTITVASPGIGQGTTFIVKLPVAIIYKSSSEPEALDLITQADGTIDAPLTLSGLQILVVEDEADSLELLSTILQEYGAQVISVTSVSEALEIIENATSQSLDVLVSDIGMPNEDGYSLIRKLRQLEAQRGGRMPAVALTAYARSDDRKQALLAGFQMHLPKPVEAAELATVIASLTGRTGRF